MIRTAFSDVPRALLLLVIQVLILNQIDLFNGFVQPFAYILILLLLPFDIPAWVNMLIGLACGLIIDMFTFTPGMHTSACLMLCFVRPGVLRLLAPRDGYEFGMEPTLAHMGAAWYFVYSGILVLIHHFWLFALEVLRFDLLPSVLLRALFSSIASVLLIFLIQLLFFRVVKK